MTNLIVDERRAVAEAHVRFESALAKSDNLQDDDVSPTAKLVRERTAVEEARLNGARARMAVARDSLATFSVSVFGALPRTATVPSIPKMGENEAEERREKKPTKLLKRKLLAPKDGWLDKKGIILHSYRDRHLLLQHLTDMF